ncbi:MAG: type IV secretory system conjugative DNA transfer family protein [Pseudobdellovibrionaceae bacterium]
MSNKKSNEENSDYQLGVMGVLAVVLVLLRYQDRIEAWMSSHWLMLCLMGMTLITALVQLWRYKWRKKNPEAYSRRLAMKDMRSKGSLGPIESIFFIPPKGPIAGEINVGRTLKDQKELVLTNSQRSGHVQIVGATGRGKTQSVILPWFIQDLYINNSPILMDGKGDMDLEAKIWEHQCRQGYIGDYFKFDLSNPKASCTINPLEGNKADESAERLIASLEFESSYFRDVQHQVALMIFELSRLASQPCTFKLLYLCLTDPKVLSEIMGLASHRMTLPLKQEIQRFQALSPKEREEKYSGLISQIRPFAVGEIAEIVNGHHSDSKTHLSFERFMQTETNRCPKAAVILLNTMRHQKSGKILGKAILQTLAWATSKRKGTERFVPIFLDEFSSFVYEDFEQFLSKSRSYGVALHLSHQSVGDLEKISPSFLKTVNVNTNVKCLLGLNDPDTADYFAKHLGTRTITKQTERGSSGVFGDLERTGEMSLRDADQYKVHPNNLRNYSQGRGVLSLLVNGIPVTEEMQFKAYAAPPKFGRAA